MFTMNLNRQAINTLMTLIDCGEKQDQFTTFCVAVSILIETLDTIGVVSKDYSKYSRSLNKFSSRGWIVKRCLHYNLRWTIGIL